jgi:hypothetical protein
MRAKDEFLKDLIEKWLKILEMRMCILCSGRCGCQVSIKFNNICYGCPCSAPAGRPDHHSAKKVDFDHEIMENEKK